MESESATDRSANGNKGFAQKAKHLAKEEKKSEKTAEEMNELAKEHEIGALAAKGAVEMNPSDFRYCHTWGMWCIGLQPLMSSRRGPTYSVRIQDPDFCVAFGVQLHCAGLVDKHDYTDMLRRCAVVMDDGCAKLLDTADYPARTSSLTAPTITILFKAHVCYMFSR